MYLHSIHIQNFRGIKDLNVIFNKDVNVIIGPNASHKTALIDALRLFFEFGKPNRDLEISIDDFYMEKSNDTDEVNSVSTRITIDYFFTDLSDRQKGAFYSYIYMDGEAMFARVTLTYELSEKQRVISSITIGNPNVGRKIDWQTLDFFVSYYLSAIRDSTRDLMSTKNNILGKVLKRKVERADTEQAIIDIFRKANENLLQHQVVVTTQQSINSNLEVIYKTITQEIGLQIEPNRLDYIVNVIKPFIQSDSASGLSSLHLKYNSLGFNNIIYIATVLGDLADRRQDDDISVCALFIEEPEAHLHPQLQLNLFNFLEQAEQESKSQIFITTHSPTLTSRVPLEHIILLGDGVRNVGNCFVDRSNENIVYDKKKSLQIDNQRINYYKQMLIRYLDVTKSQLFFARGCCFVEGISEALLLNTMSKIVGKCLVDNEIEIVNVGNTSFAQFLMLYNSSDKDKRLPQKVAVITDEDQYTDSKNAKYNSPEKLLENQHTLLDELRNGINNGITSSRVDNLRALANGQNNILIASGKKTLEFQICRANITADKAKIEQNLLYNYLKELSLNGFNSVDSYINSLSDSLTDSDQMNFSLLLWKCLPDKAEFSQGLADYIENKLQAEEEIQFNIPSYILDAINHLVV